MIFRILTAALFALCAAAATAATLEPPSVDYCADRVIEAKQGTMTQKVCASGLKERVQSTMAGMQMVSIVRHDKEVMWTLMPAQKMYMEIGLKQALAQEPASPEIGVEIVEVGAEKIDGIAATKYRLKVREQSADSFVWLTRERIPLRFEVTVQEGGESQRVVMRLENLQVGKQDAALFELPAGYSKMPSMGGFGLPMGR
jgi:outer membrane lipoprotein-sorting protein